MITRRPRSYAVREYWATSSGVRGAERTWASVPMPNSAQASAAAFMVGQSESLHITMPTSGLGESVFAVVIDNSICAPGLVHRLARGVYVDRNSGKRNA